MSSTPSLSAVCSWSLAPRDPADLIGQLRACGCDAVQLALTPLAEPATGKPDVWSSAGSALRDAGISIVSGMLATVGEDYSSIAAIARTGGVRPDATWPATRARAIKVASVARHLSLRLVTFHAGFLPHDRSDPERQRMLERLREIAGIFAAGDIEIALETGQEPAETLVEALEDLGLASVGVNFDPANMILYGSGDPIAALAKLAPWVKQVHIKDAIASGVAGQWGREVPAGTGQVAWPAFMAGVARCPQRPHWVIEREAGETRIADITAARSLMQRLASVG